VHLLGRFKVLPDSYDVALDKQNSLTKFTEFSRIKNNFLQNLSILELFQELAGWVILNRLLKSWRRRNPPNLFDLTDVFERKLDPWHYFLPQILGCG
jgi:hypothetical protein